MVLPGVGDALQRGESYRGDKWTWQEVGYGKRGTHSHLSSSIGAHSEGTLVCKLALQKGIGSNSTVEAVSFTQPERFIPAAMMLLTVKKMFSYVF